MSRRNSGTKLRMVKDLTLVLALIISVMAKATEGGEPIFTEGGGAIPLDLEEGILEELSKDQQGQQDERDFVGVSSADKEQPKPDIIADIPKEPPRQPLPAPSPSPSSPPVDLTAAPKPPPAPPAPAPALSTNAKQQYEDLKSAAAAAIMKQTSSLLQHDKPSKQKKEGQEEFATFVDPFSQPAQNRRLVAEKQSHNGHFGHEEKRAPIRDGQPKEEDLGDTVFIAVVAVCSAVGILGFAVAGYTFYSLHKQYKAAQDAEYPHYGVTGPAKERTSGSASPVAAMDAKLASSAQLYHYQHTKQQIIAMEHSTGDAKGQESEDSEGEGEEGDYSVYECPGLAPTGDIEVSNPLFENLASPHAKVDPRQQQEEEASPRVHQRAPVRGEDP